VAEGRCSVRDEDPAFPSARIVTDAATWLALDEGRLSSIDAFLDDRIRVRGNVEHAVRMQSLFRPAVRARTPQTSSTSRSEPAVTRCPASRSAKVHP
jgi:putative sterol carrier protein